MKRFYLLSIAVLVSFFLTGALFAWSPGTGSPNAIQGFSVDTTNRFDVLSFYNCIYFASEGYATDIVWSGNVGSGISGTTSAAFKDDVRRRINFYRALVGVTPDIVFDATDCSKDQDAALMFAANMQISHTPPPTWIFFTLTGSAAASMSNIGWGEGTPVYGPAAVDGYMVDAGSNNAPVGHRRWLLYSQQQTMGTGDIPPTTVVYGGTTYNNVSTNAIWIGGPFKPTPLLKAVYWPNAGYIPLSLMPARWSVTYPGADFSAASVTMQKSGTNVGLSIVSSNNNGMGDNTIVWEPVGLPSSLSADTAFSVTVSGAKVSGTLTSFSYYVTLFDPNVLGSTVAISGTNAPFITGEPYTFNSIPSADAYQLRVSTNSAAQWTEGAEDSPTPQIQATTTGTFPLRQTAVKRSGSKAFQLQFSDVSFADQSFMIIRDVIPSATSQLQFYDLLRFATSTTSLNAQVSTDNGNTWTTLWSRVGNDSGSSLYWDTSFNLVSQSLASYAGQLVKMRFLLHFSSGSGYVTTSSNPDWYGFFVDDITVTNAIELVNTTTTTLSGSANSFTLNATTAGSALVAGTAYSLRVRPSVGLRWYSDSPILSATTQALMKYSDWVTKLYPGITGGPTADKDRDGLPNGIEFAFGLNPTSGNSPSALPQPVITPSSISVSFSQPDGVTGVTYGAEWSSDLVHWNAITDTGSGTSHVFSANTTGAARAFFRYKVIIQP